jgi:Reverse transcriptase (RNA-dependent DNA polymerase)
MSDRTQSVSVNGAESAPVFVTRSVPQESVLGPLEFIFYTDDVVEVFQKNSVCHHLFADDKQVLYSTKIAHIVITCQRLSNCIADVHDWCASRRLQPNASKNGANLVRERRQTSHVDHSGS